MSLLQIEGLGIDFGGLRAVNDVGFSLKPGEIVSVIGPNGAGKTTLFNMISGVYAPARGRVVLDGEDVTRMPPHLLARRGLSRTFQNLQIFQSMSVLENAVAGHHLHERGPVLADLFSLPAARRRSRASEESARTLLEPPSRRRARFPTAR
jgi:branched-chain amino acid transport system ATP-binding protein